ncbi:hypothetical protein ACFQ1S_00295 [Kibdelosporangium lantanae]|uniref:Uncharacterized protein n=1 Tax=Kibdelosporangium lantanae TaxID=1497396 RepID=A0ABW3M1H2_9PSEU
MCRAISDGGRRCPSCVNAAERGQANIRQRIGRHDRKAREAANRHDWDRETRYIALLERAISDYEKTNASPLVQATAPPPTAADRYTPMAAIEMTDDDLAAALNELNHDPAAQDQIIETLEWRDAARREWDVEIAESVEQKRREKAEHEAAWLREWEEGDASPLTNPARRSERKLKPEQICREEYDTHLYTSYLQAENECRGVLLSRTGQTQNIDPESLFSGRADRVRKYASEELKTWFARHGRITYTEWKFQWFGRESDRQAARTARYQSLGEATA